MTTFNVYGDGSREVGKTNKPVWLGTVAPHVAGGVFASKYCIANALYAAGTPIKLEAGVISPLLFFVVTAFSAGDGTTTLNDTITIKPAVIGGAAVLPKAEDLIQKLGATFETKGKAAVVVSVTENAVTAGTYDVAVAHSATVDTPSVGDIIVFSAATSAGSNKSIEFVPNAYLYNDVFIGDLANAKATGAAVDFHGEGLLVDFTPAAEVKDQMKAAVPTVVQHRFPSDAFVTIS